MRALGKSLRPFSSLISLAILLLALSFGAGALTSCGSTSGSPGGTGNPTLTSVSVSPGSASVAVGATQAFMATGTFSDASTKDLTSTATWTSSNTADATVQTASQANPGTATGVAKGSVTITASMSGVSGTAALTITAAGNPTLVSIAVTPANAGIAVGGTVQFTATGQYSDGSTKTITNSVAWASSNTADATVTSGGLATGVAGGSVTITATLTGVTGSASLTVTSQSATIVSIAVDPVNPSIPTAQTQQFFANATFSDGTVQDITSTANWSSSNTAVATIQTTGQAQPGLATGVVAGAATITAAQSGKSGSTTLTVTTSSGNGQKIPLMDMTAAQNYLSFPGGLYENSSDTVPSDHDADGKTVAATIQPLDTNGNPSASGKVVFTSIGMSNAADEFGEFIGIASPDSQVNHTTLVIANGAKGGITTCYWEAATGNPPCSKSTENQYDRVRDQVLTPLGLTEKQVQVVWLKEANGGPGVVGCGTGGGQPCQSLCDPSVPGCQNTVTTTEALRYESQVGVVLRAAKTRWPNLKLAFLSTRIFAGYATVDLNPEPYAYEYGFSAKWLVQAQINQIRTGTVDPTAGDLNYNNATAPWTAWGPYIWANGPNPRSDGLVWCDGQSTAPCSGEVDFQTDGTHPNSTGQKKVATMLLNFFLGSPYTTSWFAAP